MNNYAEQTEEESLHPDISEFGTFPKTIHADRDTHQAQQ
jgi:hypothetical protein